MQAQRGPNGTQPAAANSRQQRMAPVESLTSLDLDDLEGIQQPNLADASKQARLQDSNDAQLAKTLLAGKLAILGLGVRC